jgi:hypothetical protein
MTLSPALRGFVYDSERDAALHANDALITKVFPDGRFQRHDLKTEQATITVPYEQSFFEYEVGTTRRALWQHRSCLERI